MCGGAEVRSVTQWWRCVAQFEGLSHRIKGESIGGRS